MAYVMLLELIERRMGPLVIGAIVARAQGAKGDIPEVADAIDDFERSLVAEPAAVDPDKLTLMRALGVA